MATKLKFVCDGGFFFHRTIPVPVLLGRRTTGGRVRIGNGVVSLQPPVLSWSSSTRPRQQQQHHHHLYHQKRCFLGLSSLPPPPSPPQVLMENVYRSTKSSTGDENDENNNNADKRIVITKITLDRPKANAMGKQMISELNDCLDVLEGQKGSTGTSTGSSRCVVLTSSSARVFSAGADLKERAAMTEDDTERFVALLRTTLQRVALLPMPVIAAVEGVALGGGLELALAADLRIVSENAVLGLPETTLAILPGAGGTQRLSRLIGPPKAKELIWTGKKMSGRAALGCGLVNEVVAAGQETDKDTDNDNDNDNDSSNKAAEKRAIELAFEIASNGPVAIRASKMAIDRGGEALCMEDALEIEREAYGRVIPTRDRLEGLRAFREGRAPFYTGE